MIRLANRGAETREVIILCGSEYGPARERVDNAVRVVAVSPELRRSPVSRLLLGRAVRAVLPGLRPDILVGPGNHVLPVFAAMGRIDIPTVCKLSNPADLSRHDLLPRWLLRWLSARACRPLSAIVAMSPALAEEAAAFLGADSIATIPEPIFENEVAARDPLREGPLRLLCAARLVRQKNVGLALRALVACPPATSLTIAGDGPDMPALRSMVDHLGLEKRVRFAGHVPDIGPLLADSDALLLPSLYEGYPAVLIEAIAAGVPVVTTQCSPAISEILLHNSFGRVADPDPVALADAVMAVAGRPVDDTARTALIDRHRADAGARQWLALLDALVMRVDSSGGVSRA